MAVIGGNDIKRKCGKCRAQTTIDGMAYCWKCREKLPLHPTKRHSYAGAFTGVAVWLGGIGVVAATIWWALQ